MSREYPCVHFDGGKCKLSRDESFSFCVYGPCKDESPSNADRIRSMSDEEMADFVCFNAINTLCDIICDGDCNAVATLKKSGDEACKEIVMKWLQQPVEEESDG